MIDEAKKDRCPKCDGKDVAVARSVLECFECGWTRIEETPCHVCGEPAVACVGGGGKVEHWCTEHCPREDELLRKMADAMYTPLFKRMKQ